MKALILIILLVSSVTFAKIIDVFECHSNLFEANQDARSADKVVKSSISTNRFVFEIERRNEDDIDIDGFNIQRGFEEKELKYVFLDVKETSSL